VVEVFVNTQKIGTLLVSENHFTERNYVKLPTYTTYIAHPPDQRAYAGSAVIIRKEIYETSYIQATNMGFEDQDGNLTISAMYLLSMPCN
jgi:hypothetical protein